MYDLFHLYLYFPPCHDATAFSVYMKNLSIVDIDDHNN